MLQRGRKSSKAVGLAPVVTLERIVPPPECLSENEAKTWLVVARSPTFSLIGQDSYPVLIEYCRVVAAADDVAAQLAAFDSSWLAEDEGFRRWERLLKLQVAVSGRMSELAVKLRIAPSTRANRDHAATLHKKGMARKPWEVENEED